MLYARFQTLKGSALRRLRVALRDETGATVAEYALVLVLVSLAVITVLGTLGETLQSKIMSIVSRLQGVQ